MVSGVRRRGPNVDSRPHLVIRITAADLMSPARTTVDPLSLLDAANSKGQTVSRVTTLFDFHSDAADVLTDVDLSGRTAIVTGGGAGIGLSTARALARAGASVTLAVRRPAASERVAAQLRSETGNQAITIAPLDLADLRSVKAFVDTWHQKLDILVNNAGIMALPEREKTPQGFELQYCSPPRRCSMV